MRENPIVKSNKHYRACTIYLLSLITEIAFEKYRTLTMMNGFCLKLQIAEDQRKHICRN